MPLTKSEKYLLAGVGLFTLSIGGFLIMREPRGIRNNNPGNIRKIGNWHAWKGIAPEQTDPEFLQFSSPEWGLRALAVLLRNYQQRHGLNTIRGVISRYAPGNENDTNAYIQSVAQSIGASPDAPLDFTNRHIVRGMLVAITRHENGKQPYDIATLDRALDLGGFA